MKVKYKKTFIGIIITIILSALGVKEADKLSPILEDIFSTEAAEGEGL